MKIKLSTIKIDRSTDSSKRFRSDFGDIQAMADSIKLHGLIHPIVVDEIKDGSIVCAECGGGGSVSTPGNPSACLHCLGAGRVKVDARYRYVLVAGERRMTATALLGHEEIEATIRSELTPLQRKELELEENVQRMDINWMERNEAIRQLHELKVAEHGARLPGDISGQGWVIDDTAKLIGASHGSTVTAIKMARELQEHPELIPKVAGLTMQIAKKTIEREKQAAVMQRKINQGLIEVKSDLMFGKAEELIKTLPDASVHCLITDPPFAVERIHEVSQGNLASGNYDRGENVGEIDVMEKTYEILIPELARVLIPGAHFYMFFGIEWYEYLKSLFGVNGMLADPVPLVWAKNRGTMIPNPYHYVPSYEYVMFGHRIPMSRTLSYPRANCITECPADAGMKRVHPLQKPYDLIHLFISNSTVPGETVLDCFAGSGIVLKVANDIGRKAIGFEKDQENYLIARKFLQEKEQ